jgi:hypothetical protein
MTSYWSRVSSQSNITGVLYKTWKFGHRHKFEENACDHEGTIKVMYLQAKQSQRPQVKLQKQGDRPGADPFQREHGPAVPLVSDFIHPCLKKCVTTHLAA